MITAIPLGWPCFIRKCRQGSPLGRSPLDRAALSGLLGRILFFCSYEKFQPCLNEIEETKPNWWKILLYTYHSRPTQLCGLCGLDLQKGDRDVRTLRTLRASCSFISRFQPLSVLVRSPVNKEVTNTSQSFSCAILRRLHFPCFPFLQPCSSQSVF